MQNKLQLQKRLKNVQKAHQRLSSKVEAMRKDNAHLASDQSFERYKQLLTRKIALLETEKRILLALAPSPVRKEDREHRPKQ